MGNDYARDEVVGVDFVPLLTPHGERLLGDLVLRRRDAADS